MHPLFFAVLVLAVGFAALALVATEVRPRRRRHRAAALPAWMDLDGSARRHADRWPAAHA